MKNILFIGMVLLFAHEANAQSGQKWSLNGNAAAPGDYLGTTNAVPLHFRTNNVQRFSISPTGGYTFHSLADTSKGFLVLNQQGVASRLNFTGNPNQVLLGNGSWGSIGLLNNSGWSVQNGVTTTGLPVSVGGLIVPNYQMSVAGNFFASGKISAMAIEVVQLVYADTVKGGKQFRLSESLRFKGIDNNDPNSRNDICGMGAPLYIQSNGASSHTIFNYGNATNVGIGTNAPQYKLHVVGNTSFDGVVRLPQLAGSGGLIGVDTQGNLESRSFEMMGPAFYSLPCLTDNNGNSIPTWKNSPNILYAGGIPCENNIRVGINTTSPAQALHVEGSAIVTGTLKIGTSSIFLGGADQNTGTNNTIYATNTLFVQSDANNAYNTVINGNNTGFVGIGVLTPSYKLDVGGTIRACRILVETSSWCDFVFEQNYQLRPISELERYIKQYGHLPNFRSAMEIIQSGHYDVAEMDKALLQTVEENTLYIIELKKENETLLQLLLQLENRVRELEGSK